MTESLALRQSDNYHSGRLDESLEKVMNSVTIIEKYNLEKALHAALKVFQKNF